MSELDAKVEELTKLLTDAFGSDITSNAMPSDPADLDMSKIVSWNDMAAVLAAYPQGVPIFIKNQMIDMCKKLTQEGHANPNLSVQVGRMPILGGKSTRVLKQMVASGPAKKRTGLTRTGGGLSLMHMGTTRPNMKSAPMLEEAEHITVSPEELKKLETAASKMYHLLKAMPAEHQNYAGLKNQTRQSFIKLKQALQTRLHFLIQEGEANTAIQAYEKAMMQIDHMIDSLT